MVQFQVLWQTGRWAHRVPGSAFLLARSSGLYSQTPNGSSMGYTQVGHGQQLSQGLHPGHRVVSPTGPQGLGRWALRGREGEGAVTQKREMTETFLLRGCGEGGTPRVSAAINQGPQDREVRRGPS